MVDRKETAGLQGYGPCHNVHDLCACDQQSACNGWSDPAYLLGHGALQNNIYICGSCQRFHCKPYWHLRLHSSRQRAHLSCACGGHFVCVNLVGLSVIDPGETGSGACSQLQMRGNQKWIKHLWDYSTFWGLQRVNECVCVCVHVCVCVCVHACVFVLQGFVCPFLGTWSRQCKRDWDHSVVCDGLLFWRREMKELMCVSI